MNRLIASFLLISLVITSCGGIQNMRVQVIRPAKVTIHPSVQSMAVLNCSLPEKNEGIEGIITGEAPSQDKKLSEECLRGLNETLNTSVRFKIVRCEGSGVAPDGKSLGYGAPLEWGLIDSLCGVYQTDALMVLEFFDTDYSILNPGAAATEALGSLLNGGNGLISVSGTAKASAGFRIYDPKTRNIIYENRFNYSRVWTEQSSNPIDAVAKLMKKDPALVTVSYETGSEFALSIVPLYYWENRDMYRGKKHSAMRRGERQALSKDWDGAVQTWTEVYESSYKSKTRAKAAFNVALGYEVNGKLEEAQTWIQKSYIEGGKQEQLHYSNILDRRVREQQTLKVQTGQ